MSTIPIRQPDFFIVGAPKSGTTALHTFLRGHPEIFLPPRKDRPFFGSDLDFRRWRLSPTEYADELRLGGDAPLLGHTCVWYLYSKRAAGEIRAAAGAARIVVMLRNPIDMLHAQHSQFLYNGNEDIAGFGAALAAELDRRAGRRIPRSAHFPQGLWYTDTARYSRQVERYLELFGRENVRVIFYEDFALDPAATARAVACWLGASDAPVETSVVNANKRVRSRRLQSFLIAPPQRLERAFHAATPKAVHGRIGPWLIGRNLEQGVRDPIPADVRRRLESELAGDVERLGDLLGRDVRHWLGAARAGDITPGAGCRAF